MFLASLYCYKQLRSCSWSSWGCILCVPVNFNSDPRSNRYPWLGMLHVLASSRQSSRGSNLLLFHLRCLPSRYSYPSKPVYCPLFFATIQYTIPQNHELNYDLRQWRGSFASLLYFTVKALYRFLMVSFLFLAHKYFTFLLTPPLSAGLQLLLLCSV